MNRLRALGLAFALAATAPAAALPAPPNASANRAAAANPADDAQCDTCDALELIKKADYARARRILEMRAEKGDAFAFTVLGRMSMSGWGVPVDYDRAMAFYQTGARKGDALALNQIGFMVLYGLGRPADPEAAWCWFEQAAEGGVDLSTYHLAELMAAGMQPISCKPSGAKLSAAVARGGERENLAGKALELWNGVREGMTPDEVASVVPAAYRQTFEPGAQFSERPNSDVLLAPATVLGVPAFENVTFVDHAVAAVVLNIDHDSDDPEQGRQFALALAARFDAAYGPSVQLAKRDGAVFGTWRRGDLSVQLMYMPLPGLPAESSSPIPPGFSVSFTRLPPDLAAPPATVADGEARQGG